MLRVLNLSESCPNESPLQILIPVVSLCEGYNVEGFYKMTIISQARPYRICPVCDTFMILIIHTYTKSD